MGSAKLLALVLKTLAISGALCTNSTSVPLNVGAKGATGPPNLVFIVCDQLRFDAIGHVQRRRLDYKGKTLIETPNIDELAESGAWFKTAYWYVRGRYPCPRYGPKTNQLSTFSKSLCLCSLPVPRHPALRLGRVSARATRCKGLRSKETRWFRKRFGE